MHTRSEDDFPLPPRFQSVPLFTRSGGLLGTLPRRTLPGRWLLPDAATVAAAAAAIAVEADLPRNSASNGVLNRTIRYRCGCSCRSALSSGCGAISSPAATGNEEEIRSIIGIGPRYGRFTGVGAVVMVVVVVMVLLFAANGLDLVTGVCVCVF